MGAFNDNELTGSMPKLNSKSLMYLDLGDNKLSGPIIENIFQVSSFPALSDLYLSNNKFSGTIPSWNVAESTLRDIWLENNQLTGSVPDSICIKREEYLDFKSLHVDCQPPKGSDTPRNQCAKDCCTSCFVGGVGCS